MQMQALAVLAQWDRECDSNCFLAFRLSLVSKHIPRPPGCFLQASGVGPWLALPAFPRSQGFYLEYIIDRLSGQRVWCDAPAVRSVHTSIAEPSSCRWLAHLPITGFWWAIVRFHFSVYYKTI